MDAASPDAVRAYPPWQRAAPWVGVALIGAYIAWHSLLVITANWAFTTDDAYITLRYAQHLADGHGIVWNIGESPPVEGYSNFSYVLLGALAIWLRLDPVLVFKVLGIVAVAGTCVLLWTVARTWVSPLAAAVPACVMVSYEGTWFWATSGLETPFYQLLVVAAVAAFVRGMPWTSDGVPRRPPSSRHLAAAGLLALAASITRPEGPLVAIAISAGLGVCLLLRRDLTLRERLRLLAMFLVPFVVGYGAYTAWRLSYFGRWLPNSVYCKSFNADGSTELATAFHSLALPYALVALAAFARRPRRLDPRLLVLLAVPVLYAFTLRHVDPIVGQFNRHALAAWSVLLVPATLGLGNLIDLIPRIPGLVRDVILLAVAAVWALSSGGMTPAQFKQSAASYAIRARDREAVGNWLRTHIAPGEAYVIGDCGVIPFVAGGQAIDAFCLNNREATLPPVRGSRPALIASIFDLAPAWIVVHSTSSETLRPSIHYGFYPALVADPRFARYELVARFGTHTSTYHYWIYRRRTS